MRWILGIAAAVALAWGGYWFYGAAKIRDVAQNWITAQGGSGTVAVVGFPNRFDLTLTDLDISAPQGRYSAPFVQVFSMTWKPWHLIAAFAPSQDISVLGQRLTVESSSMRASALAWPYSGFALREMRLDGADLQVVSDQGWRIGAGHVTGALDANEDAMRPRIGIRLTDVAAPLIVDGFPRTIAALTLDAHLQLSAPLDARAPPPPLLGLDIQDAALSWGDFGARISGDLAPDAAGFASGTLDITLTGAQNLPQILVAMGVVTPDQSTSLGLLLTMIGAKAKLTLTDGLIKIGALPIAAAPRWPD